MKYFLLVLSGKKLGITAQIRGEIRNKETDFKNLIFFAINQLHLSIIYQLCYLYKRSSLSRIFKPK